MDERLKPLYEILKLNSRLFLNCLAAMSEDQARWRPGDRVNSAAFVAAHLVDARHNLGTILGVEAPRPFGGRLDEARSVTDVKDMPGLDEIRSEWKAVTGNLRERFKTVSAAELSAQYAGEFPVEDRTVLGVIGFLLQHDSYHIGQLGLLRRQLGLGEMVYR
jgi:uncharacterized damage-inducible protein DinB